MRSGRPGPRPRALPNLESPIELAVDPADAGAAAALLRGYRARFVERRADGTATFLIDNPGSLTVDEHPFAVSVLRDLADAGIDVAWFHMS